MASATWIAAESDPSTGKRRIAQIRQLSRAFLPCRIADLGAGTCEISLRLKQDGADVVAIDWTEERVLPEAQGFFIKGNALTLNLADIGLIVCAGLLYHLDLSQQKHLASTWKGKPVILDTHFSRSPDVVTGGYAGQFREPSWSTKTTRPFVHTVPSLRKLFLNHILIETFERTTPDRQTMLLMPRFI